MVLEEALKFDDCCGKECFPFRSRSCPFISSDFVWFSFFKDSRESVIESPKRCSNESSAMSSNLAYGTGNDYLIKVLLSCWMDSCNSLARNRAFFRNVNYILTSNESTVSCLEGTSCFASSEEFFWTSRSLQSWLRFRSPSVIRTSVLHRFVFLKPAICI